MNLVLSSPNPRQKEFLLARSRYVAYGGARGGGKSHAVRLKATLMCLRYPGIRILILRRTYPELYENHIKIMTADLAGVASYRDSDKSMTFRGGSRIRFGYCASDADLRQYQGVEYDVIFIDEATHFTEYQFEVIRSCLRGANSYPKRCYLTCNPGGVGHGWVKRLFIDRHFREGEKPEDYTFIKSTVYDNSVLLRQDPGYLDTLKTLPDELRRAWLEGDWDIFAGQFFTEFRRDIHVCEPFPIPSHYRRYRAFDYGLDMLACLWAAVDERGEIWIYRECCRSGLIVSDAAALICSLGTNERIERTAAPPDMYNRQKDSGKSMAQLFEENGVRLTRADNDRVQGWMQLREWLKITGEGADAHAKLHIFSTCTELCRCLPLLTHDEDDPMDCATEPHEITHICDALRYLVMERTSASRKREEKNELERYKEQTIRQYARGTRHLR